MKNPSANFTPAILAGGKGTRLREIISDFPKVLAEVRGRPFITYLLDFLVRTGFREAILCTGFRGDVVSEKFAGGYQGLRIKCSQEGSPLGTGGAIRNALDLIPTSRVLLMNGDSFTSFDIYAYISWFESRGSPGSLLLTRVEDVSRYGSVEMSPSGEISSFTEKGVKTGPGLINAGVYLLEKNLLAAIPTNKEFSLEREFFPGQVGHGLSGFPCNGPFIDIGTPESFSLAESFFRT